MSGGPKLELKQSQTQSLVMTQQLQQSIKLLQMTSLELQEFIEQEIEQNPLLSLEGGEPNDDDTPRTDVTDISVESESDDGDISAPEASADNTDASDWLDTTDDQIWDEGSDTMGGADSMFDGHLSYNTAGGGSGAGEDDEGQNILEQTVSSQESLQEHLLEQLMVDVHDPVMRILGGKLIELIDESGYLTAETTPLLEQLGCDAATLERTIQTLQGFDPVGVFARSLAECLALQLKDKNRYDPAMEALLANLDILAKGDLLLLSKRCHVDMEDLREMIAEIKMLDPKPASHFVHDVVQVVQPDVFLRRAKNGGWQIELNTQTLPRVLINKRYHAELSKQVHRKEDRKYLNEHMANANWLVRALDQRANTLLKVSTEIVAQQDAFFRNGITHLKPLTLKDIADTVGMHESTVSRVTTNKYLATSARGNFELRYFFTSSIASSRGKQDVSSKTVQYYIEELIGAEDPANPLSDDALAVLLKQKGMDAARRTVAKYREGLNIPTSATRKRTHKMSLL